MTEHDPLVYMDQYNAQKTMIMIMEHLADWPIRSAEGFRNVLLGNGGIAINPLLAITDTKAIDYLTKALREVVAEGRMIDFGFLPNQMIKTESIRSRKMFEAGEFQHPYETWLAISSWEGGACGYYFTPHPEDKGAVLCIELYGVSIPNGPDTILVYDIVGVAVHGEGDTRVHPHPMDDAAGYGNNIADMQARGANCLDPLVTMLRLLADASIPLVDHPAPTSLNKRRTKRGQFAIPSHFTVDTRDYVTAFRAAQAGATEKGTHASPVAHWRRAHKRHLPDGRVVPVRSSKVNWRDTAELHRLLYKVSPQ
jgi:hypothetical protein